MQELSLHILDLARNSIAAEAKVITISLRQSDTTLIISIKDDGKGMDTGTLENVRSPFTTSRTTRRIGLGIPLFQAAAEQSGGALEIRSDKGIGTTVTGTFVINNIDRQPLGDLTDTITALIVSEKDTDFELILESVIGEYRLDTKEIKNILSGVSISEPEVMDWIAENVREGIRTVFGGVLNEINTGT